MKNFLPGDYVTHLCRTSHARNCCIATKNIAPGFRRVARSAVSDNDVLLSQQAKCIYLPRS